MIASSALQLCLFICQVNILLTHVWASDNVIEGLTERSKLQNRLDDIKPSFLSICNVGCVACCFAVSVFHCSFSSVEVLFFHSQIISSLVSLLRLFMSPKKLRSEALWMCQEQRGRSFYVWQQHLAMFSTGEKRSLWCCFQSLTLNLCTAVRHRHTYCIKILLLNHFAVTLSWQSDIRLNSSDTCGPERLLQ